MQMQIPGFHLYIEVIQNFSGSLVWLHPTSFRLMSLLTGLFIQSSLFQTKKKHNTTFFSLSLSLARFSLLFIYLKDCQSQESLLWINTVAFWATTDCSVSHRRRNNNKCNIHVVTQSFEIPWEIKQKRLKTLDFCFASWSFTTVCVFFF